MVAVWIWKSYAFHRPIDGHRTSIFDLVIILWSRLLRWTNFFNLYIPCFDLFHSSFPTYSKRNYVFSGMKYFSNHELLRRDSAESNLNNSAGSCTSPPSQSRSNCWSCSRMGLSRSTMHIVSDGFVIKRWLRQPTTWSKESVSFRCSVAFASTSGFVTYAPSILLWLRPKKELPQGSLDTSEVQHERIASLLHERDPLTPSHSNANRLLSKAEQKHHSIKVKERARVST